MDLGLERIGTGGLPGFWVLRLLGPGPQAGREVLEASTQAPDRRWPGSLRSTRCHPGWRRVGPPSLEEPRKWECEGGFLCCPCPPHKLPQAQEAAGLSARMLIILTTSSPCPGPALSLELGPACPGLPRLQESFGKGMRRGGPVSALSRSIQQGYGTMRSYVYKMNLFKVLFPSPK